MRCIAEDQAARLRRGGMSARRHGAAERVGRRSTARLAAARHRRAAPRGATARWRWRSASSRRRCSASPSVRSSPRGAARLEALVARRAAREPISRLARQARILEPRFRALARHARSAAGQRDPDRGGAGTHCRIAPRRCASSISAPAPGACCWRCCRSCRTPPASASISSPGAVAMARRNAAASGLRAAAVFRRRPMGRRQLTGRPM